MTENERHRLVNPALGVLALFIGVPGTALFLPYSFFSVWGSIADLIYREGELLVNLQVLGLGAIGSAGIVAYWASLVLVFEAVDRPIAKTVVLAFLAIGIALAIYLLVGFGRKSSIFFVPIILAAAINALALYLAPLGGQQNNKGFNRTPESSGPAKPGESGGGAG